jgi:hypothetical protein
MLNSDFFDFIIADSAAGGFNEFGFNGNAFIDSEASGFKLTKNFRVDLILSFSIFLRLRLCFIELASAGECEIGESKILSHLFVAH